MSEKPVQPWIAVNKYMRDEYRETVVSLALRHLRSASKQLRQFAVQELSRTIVVPGFRSPERAPVDRLQPLVVKEMQRNARIAVAVVCVWAEAEQELIDALKIAAEAAGLKFRHDWSWHEARDGFYRFEDVMPLAECAESLGEGKSEVEVNHLRLATLWLSRAVIPLVSKAVAEPAVAPPIEPVPGEPVPSRETSNLPQEMSESIDALGSQESLSILYQMLQDTTEGVDQARRAVVSSAHSTLTAAEASNLPEAEMRFTALQDALCVWRNKHDDLVKVVRRAISCLIKELRVRPDLNLTVPRALAGDTEPSSAVVDALDLLPLFQSVLEYDEQKRDVSDQIIRAWARIVELEEDLNVWSQDEMSATEAPRRLIPDTTEMTLAKARESLDQASAELRRLERRRSQLRESSLGRIRSLAGRLQEFGLPNETVISDDLSLESLISSDIAEQPSSRLWSLEQRLVDLLDEQVMKTRSSVPSALAKELRDSWDDSKLVALLDRLATEMRDVEALMLLLAANAAHPRATAIRLGSSAVSALLRGIAQLSSKARPFELLNLLASDFLNGWEASTSEKQAEMCMTLMAAHYSGGRQLPDGFLWQLPAEWPVAGMPNWDRLWRSTLINNCLPVIVSTQSDDEIVNLEQARSRAAQMLARDHGVFLRLKSLKSGRHQTLLRNTIMPALHSQLTKLQEFERSLQSSTQHEVEHLLKHLEEWLAGERRNLLSIEALTETYEAGVREMGVDDSDPFHRRTALRILKDCAESIADYGEALSRFWRKKLRAGTSVTIEDLRMEVAKLPDLTPLGQAGLDQLAQAAGAEPVKREDDAVIQALTSRHLVHELLTCATYALRLPRVVRHLTGAQLDWARLLSYVLDDLSEPLDEVGAAKMLLEEAPNQVLLLTQYIPLDVQKQAQSLRTDKEHDIDELQTELMRLGGSFEDLLDDRELGRWGFVRQELQKRLAEQRLAHETEQQQVQDYARQLRRKINDLDLSLFDSQSTMPADVYQLVRQGLDLARRATEKATLLNDVEAYLGEIRYRLEHQAWSLGELQSATAWLEHLVAGELVTREPTPRAEEVLDLLERGELRRLGLSPDAVTPSEIETRCELLHNWLGVRHLPTLFNEELKATDRESIQSLFRYFGQMTAMKRWRPQGRSMDFEDPFVYSFWELQYPKTDVLNTECVLVTLPGNPPSARDLSQIELILGEKGWLDDYFVFLFIPGSTPKIYERFRTKYTNSRLVIIDESAILDMILAEAESSYPLGRLRPLMLNSLGAENVEVFKINQAVEPRTAIFVGRDSYVDRIVSSGNNYALYGGRRIGKSSVLKAIKERLEKRGVSVVLHSFEGEADCSDDASARKLAHLLKLEGEVQGIDDFKQALQTYLDSSQDLGVALLLDEIDRYILANTERHILIETLRALSEQYGSRVRVVVAGFMSLYDCLRGRGPYTPTSDPWRRMLNDPGPLENLHPLSAERIVREGFGDILGWKFEKRAIPQRIVEKTGGHPAFVQDFCLKLQQRIGMRGDRLVRLEDVEAIFADQDPEQSFIAYVRKTLELNLDPLGRYLIVWLAAESSEAQSFTLDQARELATLSKTPIPEETLSRSLEQLLVTSVVKERVLQVYEFSVPDYPFILNRLGETAHLERLEGELDKYLEGEC